MNLEQFDTYNLVNELLARFAHANSIEFLTYEQLRRIQHNVETELKRRAAGGTPQ